MADWHAQGLQATLSAGSAVSGGPMVAPHHPITCNGKGLGYDPEEGFWCDHAKVGPDDDRTYFAVMQSVAILIMEGIKDL